MIVAEKHKAVRGELWETSTTADELTSSDHVASRDEVFLFRGDVMNYYERWPSPVVIIADGPYGLGSFPGDPPTVEGLVEWYGPRQRVVEALDAGDNALVLEQRIGLGDGASASSGERLAISLLPYLGQGAGACGGQC